METVIEIEKVTKKFGSQMVLDEVTLCCEQGKIYGIVGYNGCGKSVLFKCICGLYHPDSGVIRVLGKTLFQDIEIIPDMGAIIEEPAFINNYDALKNLNLLYMLNHKKDTEKMKRELQRVGLDPESKKKVRNYSLGMKQRLAIAQAIMEDARILVLDEPMNGLDKEGAAEIRKLLLELRDEGKTILLASHNPMDIDVLCDEVYELEHGRLIGLAGERINFFQKGLDN